MSNVDCMMKEVVTQEAADRLSEIADQMEELLHEAMQMVRNTPEEDRSRMYWYGHIASAIGSGEYRTYAPTMRSTIKALEGREDDDTTY
jgi:hypothetical protein